MALSPGQIALVLPANPGDVVAKPIRERRGQRHQAVLATLALPYGEPGTVEVDVLDPQVQAFLQPQPRTVQERTHESRRPSQLAQ